MKLLEEKKLREYIRRVLEHEYEDIKKEKDTKKSKEDDNKMNINPEDNPFDEYSDEIGD